MIRRCLFFLHFLSSWRTSGAKGVARMRMGCTSSSLFFFCLSFNLVLLSVCPSLLRPSASTSRDAHLETWPPSIYRWRSGDCNSDGRICWKLVCVWSFHLFIYFADHSSLSRFPTTTTTVPPPSSSPRSSCCCPLLLSLAISFAHVNTAH